MAYHKDRPRGLDRKHQPAKKRAAARPNSTPPMDHDGLYPYLLRFTEWGAVRGLSASTVKTRHQSLRRFIAWCDERSLDDPKTITKPVLERYQKHLYYYRQRNGEPLGYGTQHGLLVPVKAFFKWLTQQNYLLYNPASELVLPKQTRGLPKTLLSVDEVERLIALADTTTPYGVRDRAILETLYSTGIRRMELVNLTLYDVDAGRKTLLVQEGKGRKDRLLPLGERALYWVERYRRDARPQLLISHDEQTLFLTDYGEPWIRQRLSTLIRKYLHHAGIDKPGACHLFRHAMATHMLDNGADIRYIQMMLGHADLSTTQIYTQVSIEKLRDINAATHPAKMAVKREET